MCYLKEQDWMLYNILFHLNWKPSSSWRSWKAALAHNAATTMLRFVLDYSQKVQPSPIRPQHILPYAFGRLDVVFAKFSPAWEFLFLRKTFCLAALPHSPNIWRALQIVITCSTHQVLASNSYSSFNVAVGLLAAQWPDFFFVYFRFWGVTCSR